MSPLLESEQPMETGAIDGELMGAPGPFDSRAGEEVSDEHYPGGHHGHGVVTHVTHHRPAVTHVVHHAAPHVVNHVYHRNADGEEDSTGASEENTPADTSMPSVDDPMNPLLE